MAIKRQENGDGFVVTEYTKVCEQHFRPEKIKKQFSDRKDLKDETTILSIFSWNKSASTPNRKLPKKRCSEQNEENIQPESEPCYLSSRLLNEDNTRPTVACENCAYLTFRIRIHVGYVWTGKFDLNTDTCGRGNFQCAKK